MDVQKRVNNLFTHKKKTNELFHRKVYEFRVKLSVVSFCQVLSGSVGRVCMSVLSIDFSSLKQDFLFPKDISLTSEDYNTKGKE